MPDAAFVTCRLCPWTGEAATYPEAIALHAAHECVKIVEGIAHNESGYINSGCRCVECRADHVRRETIRRQSPYRKRRRTSPVSQLSDA